MPTETAAKPEKNIQKISIDQHSLFGGLWFASWLFTLGFLHLSFWKSVFALVVWPYFIGHYISTLVH
jgi:hypothetical protein